MTAATASSATESARGPTTTLVISVSRSVGMCARIWAAVLINSRSPLALVLVRRPFCKTQI